MIAAHRPGFLKVNSNPPYLWPPKGFWWVRFGFNYIMRKIFSLFLFLFGVGSIAFGQATRSPFSAYGIGEPYGAALINSQGMAGLGISNPSFWYINNQNPALLVYNRFTTFHAGLVLDRRTATNGALSEINGNGNLNYFVLGVPVRPGKISSSVGLMPYSYRNFALSYDAVVEGTTTTYTTLEEGKGGISQFYWANGFTITRDFSVGVRVNYLFSSLENRFTNEVQVTQAVPFAPQVFERFYFSDFTLQAGASYRKDSVFRSHNRLNIGLVYGLQSKINTQFFKTFLRTFGGSSTALVDTLVNNARGKTVLPSSLQAGISFGRTEKWVIGTDFHYSDYRQFRNYFGSSEGGQQNWRWIIGGEFTPDPASLSNYLKRITYRTGVSIEQYPYLINNGTLRDFGINFGLSLPVSRISTLDLAVRVGRRGDVQKTSIEENYLKVYFGVTFNDQWFIKRRFD